MSLPTSLRRRWRPVVICATAVVAAGTGIAVSMAPAEAATAPAAGGTYTVTVGHTGQCLDVAGSSTASGAQVQQNTCASASRSQQWKVNTGASGRFTVTNVNSNLCLQVGGPDIGALVQQAACVGGQLNQQWSFILKGSVYQLKSGLSGWCSAVQGGSTSVGAPVAQDACGGDGYRTWTFNTAGGTTNPVPAGLVGWAAQNGTTTGGAGGSTVTVTTASALDSALQASGSRIIKVSGMISLSGMHKVSSNKTIQGVGSGSGLSGGGLTLENVSNVIIQNLNFTGSSDDAINVQTNSHHIWIDHNTFSSAYDGLVDIRLGSDYVTVSWNVTRSHDKTMLLGSADTDTGDRGKLRVTYHHNWFNGTNQRHPRVRFGNPVHVYNNYYSSIGSYGVASTTEAGVLVEGNYFENVSRPTTLAQGTSPNGNLVQRNNYFVNSGTPMTNGSVNAIPYAYTLDTASSVKASVTAGAGAGKIGL